MDLETKWNRVITIQSAVYNILFLGVFCLSVHQYDIPSRHSAEDGYRSTFYCGECQLKCGCQISDKQDIGVLTEWLNYYSTSSVLYISSIEIQNLTSVNVVLCHDLLTISIMNEFSPSRKYILKYFALFLCSWFLLDHVKKVTARLICSVSPIHQKGLVWWCLLVLGTWHSLGYTLQTMFTFIQDTQYTCTLFNEFSHRRRYTMIAKDAESAVT